MSGSEIKSRDKEWSDEKVEQAKRQESYHALAEALSNSHVNTYSSEVQK